MKKEINKKEFVCCDEDTLTCEECGMDEFLEQGGEK